MNTIFKDFTQEEYQKYSEMFDGNTRLYNGSIIVYGGDGSELTLVKHWKGDVYMQLEEGEGDFFEDNDNIYQVEPRWWTKLNNIDQLVEDVKNGEELYYCNYQ